MRKITGHGSPGRSTTSSTRPTSTPRHAHLLPGPYATGILHPHLVGAALAPKRVGTGDPKGAEEKEHQGHQHEKAGEQLGGSRILVHDRASQLLTSSW